MLDLFLGETGAPAERSYMDTGRNMQDTQCVTCAFHLQVLLQSIFVLVLFQTHLTNTAPDILNPGLDPV